MAKGVMFTITFFLLSSILIALSLLIFSIYESTEKRAAEISISNRINDLASSIEKAIVDSFNSNSGINISVQNNLIIIQEQIPANNTNNYTTAVKNFKSYVESREDFIFIDTTNADEKKLKISPVDSYFYTENSGDDENRYITNIADVKNISFYVYKTNIPVEEIEWNEFELGSTNIEITFANNTKTLSESKKINLNKEFTVLLHFNHGIDDIKIEIKNGNLLKVSNLKNYISLNMSLAFDTSENLKVYIDIPSIIDVKEFNTTKSFIPRIV